MVEVATGQGGIGVDDDHVEAGHRKDLGDAATHVAGADDRVCWMSFVMFGTTFLAGRVHEPHQTCPRA